MVRIVACCSVCRVENTIVIEAVVPNMALVVPENWRSVYGFLLCGSCGMRWEAERVDWFREWMRVAHEKILALNDPAPMMGAGSNPMGMPILDAPISPL